VQTAEGSIKAEAEVIEEYIMTARAPAARKPATKECQVCHHRVPVTDMVMIEDYVNTGKSGWSLSLDLSKTPMGKKRNRAHTGRRYYSKKKIWVCKEHAKSYVREEDTRKSKYRWRIAGVVVFLIVMAILSGL
jgi:hypothetical protein